jgi:predicted transcriptional regulator
MTAKERIVRLVENIPDDASREEVLYRLRLFHSVELGLRDVEEGKFVDDEELFDELLR